MDDTAAQPTADEGTSAQSDADGLAALDDSALLDKRAQMRAELERLPPDSSDYAALTALYDRSTEEVDDRARRAWARG